MKKSTYGLLVLIASSINFNTSFADVLSLENVVSKVEKYGKSDKDSISANALNSYNVYKLENSDDHDHFMEKVSSYRRALSKDSELKTLVKKIRQACRKSSDTQECNDSIYSLEEMTKKHFDVYYENRFFRFGVNEQIPDRFWFFTGYREWGSSSTGDYFPFTLGFGLQAARSLVNFGICALPLQEYSFRGYKLYHGRWNVGVVASAVAGAGVTSGVYIGGQGICFDFGIMYGLGAYVAVTGYNPHSPGVNQLQGDEEEIFPRRL